MFPEMFLEWIESQREPLEARGFRIESIVPTSDWDDSGRLHAVRVDFKLLEFFGDIYVWRSGECDIGVVDVETQESKYECFVCTSTGQRPIAGDTRRLILVQKLEDFSLIFEEFLAPLLEPSHPGEHT